MGVFGDLEEEKKNDNEEGKLPKLPENDNEFLLSGAQIRLSSTEECVLLQNQFILDPGAH
jgi:hypothetical protein